MSVNEATGEVEFDDEPEEEFEVIGRVFESQFAGRCTVNEDHVVRRRDRVARVHRIANPMIVVTGVACAMCVKILPKYPG